MRRFLLAVTACGLLIAAAQSASAELAPAEGPPSDIHTSPTAAIMLFVKAMNAGDWDQAGALFAPSAVIVDKMPPFEWQTFSAWRSDTENWRATFHITGFHISMMSFLVLSDGTDTGYSVQPGVIRFTEDGKPTVERGFFTVTTAKIGDRWYISGLIWTNVERSDFWEHAAPEQPIFD